MLLTALALLAPGAAAQEVPAGSAMSTVETFLEAFNRHDVDAMVSMVTNDFELHYFDDDGRASLATSGPEALRTEMLGYFADRPTVRSEMEGAVAGPVYVSFRERIVGGQSSLAVYEVRDGLIKRVWYYPAEGDQ